MKNWQDFYFIVLSIIAVIALALLPVVLPSESFDRVLQEFTFKQ